MIHFLYGPLICVHRCTPGCFALFIEILGMFFVLAFAIEHPSQDQRTPVVLMLMLLRVAHSATWTIWQNLSWALLMSILVASEL